MAALLTRQGVHKRFQRLQTDIASLVIGRITTNVLPADALTKLYQAQELIREAHIIFLREGKPDGTKD